jgi:hypothetical protein
MVSAETDEDLAVARAEVRQLREMIDVLRGELEESEARLVAERRRAAARQELDRDHGRQGVDALRVQLEAAVIERNAAVQATLAQSADEIAQLKAMIEALRGALGDAHQDATTAREAQDRAFRAERGHLHEMIAALRERLETSNVD